MGNKMIVFFMVLGIILLSGCNLHKSHSHPKEIKLPVSSGPDTAGGW